MFCVTYDEISQLLALSGLRARFIPLCAPFLLYDLPLRSPLLLHPVFPHPLTVSLPLTHFSARSAPISTRITWSDLN